MGRCRPPSSRGRAAASATARDATRFELHDGVLRVGHPRVVHPKELADERLADALDVAQSQVALVELAITDPLLEDATDHRPDGRLVARRERADGRLDP